MSGTLAVSRGGGVYAGAVSGDIDAIIVEDGAYGLERWEEEEKWGYKACVFPPGRLDKILAL